MKGVALSIETIVILVLAILVLAGLFFFFQGTFNPGADNLKLQQQRTEYCSAFANNQCSDTFPYKRELLEVCEKLKFIDRTATSTDEQKERQCCSTFTSACQPAPTSVAASGSTSNSNPRLDSQECKACRASQPRSACTNDCGE